MKNILIGSYMVVIRSRFKWDLNLI
jgi:hypothetical protein